MITVPVYLNFDGLNPAALVGSATLDETKMLRGWDWVLAVAGRNVGGGDPIVRMLGMIDVKNHAALSEAKPVYDIEVRGVSLGPDGSVDISGRAVRFDVRGHPRARPLRVTAETVTAMAADFGHDAGRTAGHGLGFNSGCCDACNRTRLEVALKAMLK